MSELATSARRAVRHARGSQCPNSHFPTFAWSDKTDRAYEIACGRWDCSFCGWRKRCAVSFLIAAGIREAVKNGERVRFMTLTDGSAGAMTVRDLYTAWNRLRTALRATDELNQYAAVVETTKVGALHLHAITTGEYIPQDRLSRLASQAGFGEICDIRAVRTDRPDADRRSADYVAKQLAGYVAKAKTTALASKTAVRRRPFRTSREWFPETLRDVERRLAQEALEEMGLERDKGRWAVINELNDGTLRVRLPKGSEHGLAPGAAPRRQGPTTLRL